MRLSGQVEYRVGIGNPPAGCGLHTFAGQNRPNELGVADVAAKEEMPPIASGPVRARDARETLEIAGVGECVERHYLDARLVREDPSHEVAADGPGAAGYQHDAGPERGRRRAVGHVRRSAATRHK